MGNVTLAIDDEVLKRARIRALEDGTSVNAIVREYLERYAREDAQRAALDRVVEAARRSTASSGSRGRQWTREELHDRAHLR